MTKTEDKSNYYNKNGMSPVEAFGKGLISREEYCGFIKGNIIKYVVRCEHKDNDPIEDIQKAMDYLYELYCLIGSEKLDISIECFKELSELTNARNDLNFKGCGCDE